ncbi:MULTISPECIES: PRC-barrel domain-containing protein [Methylocaldum]|jgi:sporulation protein YlmC with PRC-barrel domain|uniref:PRC-barrel domain-containing protein n=1 Tax=unclassified Methylocaldum TaxID=2622260 RepID=UPI00098A1EBD|nr:MULTISPECIES: PRC-barrel domain-containing protein [unclassified Methylocaldum]MBP1153024.1 sporulation protein YlmC with PRC-barrel domain [Methylocaldum sp. RMAD-M]MVF24274.1 PRC-barrel domain containing protein [Methylocaldum sp. BRCS4]
MELKLARTLVLSTLCGFVWAAGSTAQPQEGAPVAGEATFGTTVIQHELIARGWRASKLMRANVYNENNQKIGAIDDFIVSPDGSLSVAIVDVGGFLGMGAHRVAIPVQQFQPIGDKTDVSKLVLPGASKDALKALPEFKYTR